jgi:hypothetical protein
MQQYMRALGSVDEAEFAGDCGVDRRNQSTDRHYVSHRLILLDEEHKDLLSWSPGHSCRTIWSTHMRTETLFDVKYSSMLPCEKILPTPF